MSKKMDTQTEMMASHQAGRLNLQRPENEHVEALIREHANTLHSHWRQEQYLAPSL